MSNSKIHAISLVLAGIGFLDSVYLTWVKYTNQYALCGPIGDCESVNTSKYSEVMGIPVALLGAFVYLVIIFLLFIETKNKSWRYYGLLSIFGITVAGGLYSIYLTYLEIAVIRAICLYCVVSAVVIILLLMLNGLRLSREINRIDDN